MRHKNTTEGCSFTLLMQKIVRFLSRPALLSAVFGVKTNVIHMWHAHEKGLRRTSWKLWINWAFRVSGHRQEVQDGTYSTKSRRQQGFYPLSSLSGWQKTGLVFLAAEHFKRAKRMWLTIFGADTNFYLTEDASVHETVVKPRMQDGTSELSAFQHLKDKVEDDVTSLTASTEMSKTTTRVLLQILPRNKENTYKTKILKTHGHFPEIKQNIWIWNRFRFPAASF